MRSHAGPPQGFRSRSRATSLGPHRKVYERLFWTRLFSIPFVESHILSRLILLFARPRTETWVGLTESHRPAVVDSELWLSGKYHVLTRASSAGISHKSCELSSLGVVIIMDLHMAIYVSCRTSGSGPERSKLAWVLLAGKNESGPRDLGDGLNNLRRSFLAGLAAFVAFNLN